MLKPSTTFRLKSHPDKLLYDHLKAVGRGSVDRVSGYRFLSEKGYDELARMSWIVGVSHDFGKSTPYFQRKLDSGKGCKLSWHSDLSSLFCYYALNNEQSEDLAAIGYLAVRRHHGNLKDVHGEEDRRDSLDLELIGNQVASLKRETNGFRASDELKLIYSDLLPETDVEKFLLTNMEMLWREVRRGLRRLAEGNDLSAYFRTLIIYSVLQDADKSDAGNTIQPPRVRQPKYEYMEHYREEKFTGKMTLLANAREKAYKDVLQNLWQKPHDRLFSITLPTGYGKTLSGMGVSLSLRDISIEEGMQPRIIYALPFLSIIDQNGETIKGIFRTVIKREPYTNELLIHHHLADLTYHYGGDGSETEGIDLPNSLFLSEGWNSEVIITSFEQLFSTLVTNKKGMLRKFHRIPGSIIMLDEVQAIPAKYWDPISKSLEYLSKELGCRIILMTATKPHMLRRATELACAVEPIERVRYLYHGRTTLEEFVNKALEGPEKRKLLILNTINESREVYLTIKSRLCKDNNLIDDGFVMCSGSRLFYLSSAVLPSERLQRIKSIKDGNDAIIVSTQVVEAGVDIDTDVVFRDFAPLDSIIQSAGRCNREANNSVSDVHIFDIIEPMNKRSYSSYVYDSVLLDVTRTVLGEPSTIREKDVLEKLDLYYEEVSKRVSQDNLIDHLKGLNFNELAKFSLIEDYGSLQVFLPYNDEAADLLSHLLNPPSKDQGTKYFSDPTYKTTLEHAIVTIRKPKEIQEILNLPDIPSTSLKYVPKDQLGVWYDPEIGFEASKEASVQCQIIG